MRYEVLFETLEFKGRSHCPREIKGGFLEEVAP